MTTQLMWEDFALSPVNTSSVHIQEVTNYAATDNRGIIEVQFYTAIGMYQRFVFISAPLQRDLLS